MKGCFRDRTVMVTGAGGGMGLQITRDLLDANANVVALDIKEKPEELGADKDRLLYLTIDLSDERAVADATHQALRYFGALHHLANVAGVLWFGKDKAAADIDLSVWDQVFSINLRSMVHTIRYCVPAMITAGFGSMVHVSTVQWLRGDRNPQDAYQASKAGVCALSRSLSIQYAGNGIRSNTILPGLTLTPMQDRWVGDDSTLETISRKVPLGRIGTPADMSNAALFLLSDMASYITGVDLVVDGGLMVMPPF
jgi:3-oxoacyl-[acyl-carrier protein] reductase